MESSKICADCIYFLCSCFPPNLSFICANTKRANFSSFASLHPFKSAIHSPLFVLFIFPFFASYSAIASYALSKCPLLAKLLVSAQNYAHIAFNFFIRSHCQKFNHDAHCLLIAKFFRFIRSYIEYIDKFGDCSCIMCVNDIHSPDPVRYMIFYVILKNVDEIRITKLKE